jgi:uncharacterized repeat protein (TIGR01451 family)
VRAAPEHDVLFTRQSPLVVVETTGPRKISINKQASFTITVRNSGGIAANDVVVKIKVPEWCEVAQADATAGSARPNSSNSSQADEPLLWRIRRLDANTTDRLTLQIIPRKSRPFDLGVSWTFAPPVSQTLVEVQEPKLLMAISGPDEVRYGETKIYKLTLSNPGTGDAEGVEIVLAPIDQRHSRESVHRIGNLKSGGAKVIEVELTARQAGTLSVKASATADGGLRSEVAHDVLVRRADLRVHVSAPRTKYAGTVATYSVRVTNPGNASAQNVEVSVVLPRGASYVSNTGAGQPTSDRSKVIWVFNSLRAGAREEFEVKCALMTPGTNRLHVAARADDDLTDSLAASTDVEALADLELDVTDPQGPIAVGEEMEYIVRIRNRGTKAAEGIELLCFFSAGIEPTSVEGTTGHKLGPGEVTFDTIARLGAGRDIVLKIRARADKAGNHIFRAQVACESIDTKLAAEETTRFFTEANGVAAKPTRPPRTANANNAPVGTPQ